MINKWGIPVNDNLHSHSIPFINCNSKLLFLPRVSLSYMNCSKSCCAFYVFDCIIASITFAVLLTLTPSLYISKLHILNIYQQEHSVFTIHVFLESTRLSTQVLNEVYPVLTWVPTELLFRHFHCPDSANSSERIFPIFHL